MASANQSKKGNPAHTRMANKHRKEYRASIWAKQKERKRQNDSANRARHARNVADAAGTKFDEYIGSPWARACIRRANSPARAEARKAYYAKQPEG